MIEISPVVGGEGREKTAALPSYGQSCPLQKSPFYYVMPHCTVPKGPQNFSSVGVLSRVINFLSPLPPFQAALGVRVRHVPDLPDQPADDHGQEQVRVNGVQPPAGLLFAIKLLSDGERYGNVVARLLYYVLLPTHSYYAVYYATMTSTFVYVYFAVNYIF